MYECCTNGFSTGRGYSKILVEKSLELAKRHGYDTIIADATNIVSQHILCNRYGFGKMFGILYKDFMAWCKML